MKKIRSMPRQQEHALSVLILGLLLINKSSDGHRHGGSPRQPEVVAARFYPFLLSSSFDRDDHGYDDVPAVASVSHCDAEFPYINGVTRQEATDTKRQYNIPSDVPAPFDLEYRVATDQHYPYRGNAAFDFLSDDGKMTISQDCWRSGAVTGTMDGTTIAPNAAIAASNSPRSRNNVRGGAISRIKRRAERHPEMASHILQRRKRTRARIFNVAITSPHKSPSCRILYNAVVSRTRNAHDRYQVFGKNANETRVASIRRKRNTTVAGMYRGGHDGSKFLRSRSSWSNVFTKNADVASNKETTATATAATAVSASATLPTTQATKSLLTDIERQNLINRTANLLTSVQFAMDRDDLWESIAEKHGVRVWRTYADVKALTNQTCQVSNAADGVTVKSEAYVTASPEEVYTLFMDNARVHEYNDNCVELQDIEQVDASTKINWCATGRFGPFKARDFVTLVHFRELGNGDGFLSLAASVQHDKLPPASGYVRSEIQLSATFMKRIPDDPTKTHFIQMTQVGQLGGVADSAIAKKITQNLAEKAPIDFVQKFDHALHSAPAPQPKRSGRRMPFEGIGSLSEI